MQDNITAETFFSFISSLTHKEQQEFWSQLQGAAAVGLRDALGDRNIKYCTDEERDMYVTSQSTFEGAWRAGDAVKRFSKMIKGRIL